MSDGDGEKGLDLAEKFTYETSDGEVTLTPKNVIDHLVSGNTAPTKTDVLMFISLCKYRKLNPFLKEAYCIKFGSKPASLVVGRGLHEKLAAKNPQYDGMKSGVILKTADGIEYREGAFRMNDETIVGGWAEGFRKDWAVAKKVTVPYEDYKGDDRSAWGTIPSTMIEKVAIVQCLRSMFPEDLAGLYSVDEGPAMDGKYIETQAEVHMQKTVPNIDKAREEIEKLIELYQHLVVPEAIDSVRLDLEACNSLNEAREVYVEFKKMCEGLQSEEDKITSVESARIAGAELIKASEMIPDEEMDEQIAVADEAIDKANATLDDDLDGAEKAFDKGPEKEVGLF